MRIYIAGYLGATGAQTDNAQVSAMAKPDHVLESFYYLTSKGVKEIEDNNQRIFLDSGAFTMFTKGVNVDLKQYADFIQKYDRLIEIASSLDAIGRGEEYAQKSYDNFKTLLSYGAKVQPVHHARDPDHWLQRYIDEGHDYIFLGGMVAESSVFLREWLDHIWEKFLTNPDGTPKVKIHGFGLTTLDLMLRYPWYSVDSTSWVLKSRYGMIFLDLDEGIDNIYTGISFSNKSMRKFDDGGWHYSQLKRAEQLRIDARLIELDEIRKRAANYDPETEKWLEERTGVPQGYNAAAFAEMYGWRDHFNIRFFDRIQQYGPKKFIREQMGLFA